MAIEVSIPYMGKVRFMYNTADMMEKRVSIPYMGKVNGSEGA